MKTHLMNKIVKSVLSFFVMAIVLLASTQIVKAAGTVSSATASVSNSTVTVSGTVEASPTVYAVAIVAYDSNGNLQALVSTNVDSSNAYSTSFSLPAGTYTIKVADYEGGEFKSVADPVTVVAPPATTSSTSETSSTATTPTVTPAETQTTPPVAEAIAPAAEPVAPVQTVSPKTNDGMEAVLFAAIFVAIAFAGYTVRKRT